MGDAMAWHSNYFSTLGSNNSTRKLKILKLSGLLGEQLAKIGIGIEIKANQSDLEVPDIISDAGRGGRRGSKKLGNKNGLNEALVIHELSALPDEDHMLQKMTEEKKLEQKAKYKISFLVHSFSLQ